MLDSSIFWILVVSGAVTAVAGLAALLVSRPLLGFVFAVEAPEAATMLFVRHWGVLIAAVGALILYAADAPLVRPPILIAAAVEKFAIVALIFLGPVKRTIPMTALACADGLFAILYVAYLLLG